MILGAVVRTLVQSVLRAIALSFALFVGLGMYQRTISGSTGPLSARIGDWLDTLRQFARIFGEAG